MIPHYSHASHFGRTPDKESSALVIFLMVPSSSPLFCSESTASLSFISATHLIPFSQSSRQKSQNHPKA